MADKKNPTGEYDVGYCRPPKEHRFPEKTSGNLKGRPKGARNLKTDLLEELSETMKVREGGRERRISKQRALIKTQVARALNGNDRAAAKIIDLYLKVTGLDDHAADADLPLTEDERAVIEKLGERLRRRAGLTARKTDDKKPDEDDDGGETS